MSRVKNFDFSGYQDKSQIARDKWDYGIQERSAESEYWDWMQAFENTQEKYMEKSALADIVGIFNPVWGLAGHTLNNTITQAKLKKKEMELNLDDYNMVDTSEYMDAYNSSLFELKSNIWDSYMSSIGQSVQLHGSPVESADSEGWGKYIVPWS